MHGLAGTHFHGVPHPSGPAQVSPAAQSFERVQPPVAEAVALALGVGAGSAAVGSGSAAVALGAGGISVCCTGGAAGGAGLHAAITTDRTAGPRRIALASHEPRGAASPG